MLKDFEETKKSLALVADQLKLCNDPELKKQNYRLIHFSHHRYIMIYYIEDGIVYIVAIYHTLQDYEKLFSDSMALD